MLTGRPSPKGVKFQLRKLRSEALGLVHRHGNRFVVGAEPAGNVLVGHGETFAAVDHQYHRIGLVHGCLRLPCGSGGKRTLVVAETPGIDDDDRAAMDVGEAIAAISGQPREVGHERVPGTGELVEERGLADVRPTHQSDCGEHDPACECC